MVLYYSQCQGDEIYQKESAIYIRLFIIMTSSLVSYGVLSKTDVGLNRGSNQLGQR